MLVARFHSPQLAPSPSITSPTKKISDAAYLWGGAAPQLPPLVGFPIQGAGGWGGATSKSIASSNQDPL